MAEPAPIVFFAHKRPGHARQALESLAANPLAAQSRLHIFCDGPKTPDEEAAVTATRQVVRERHWCGEVHVVERAANMGLAASVIAGVTEVLRTSERVIVLEDDLILSPLFLDWINNA